MLFRTQIIFCSSELRLHFRIAEVGSLLSLNRAWRAQVTFGSDQVVYNDSWIGPLGRICQKSWLTRPHFRISI